MDAIQVKDFVKIYGDYQAVKGISFNVKPGEIFGLIGPNGAGKTSTLRVLSTLLQKSGGEIKIFDLSLEDNSSEIRKFISYLPEDSGAYQNLTGLSYFKFMAKFFAEYQDYDEMIERGVRFCGLGEKLKDKVSTYSKGMTRRLLLARALMHIPRLAILDEPTSGLDILSASQIRDIIRENASQGMSILLSSHNMMEVECLCDRVALIDQGKIVEQGTCAELMERYESTNIEEVFRKVLQ